MTDTFTARVEYDNDEYAGNMYYIVPVGRKNPPYKEQRTVTALVDIAEDGTLGGIELFDNMPPPPKQRDDGGVFLIWSIEHTAWWRPNANGYTTDIFQAGLYAKDVAVGIVHSATHDWSRPPNEIAVPVDSLPKDVQAGLRQ